MKGPKEGNKMGPGTLQFPSGDREGQVNAWEDTAQGWDQGKREWRRVEWSPLRKRKAVAKGSF